MGRRSSRGLGGPVVARIINPGAAAGEGGEGPPISLLQLLRHVLRIATFILLAILAYSPFGGRWINQPSGGWDANKTADSWDTYGWDWDGIDCMYFAMVTMTTVGYGDMPTLTQGMRIFTLFFGVVGVVFVANSINFIADWFSEQARKRFIARQRTLLQYAHRVGSIVRKKQQEQEQVANAVWTKHAGAVEAPNGTPASFSSQPMCGNDDPSGDPMPGGSLGHRSRPPEPAPADAPAEGPAEAPATMSVGSGAAADSVRSPPPSPPPSPCCPGLRATGTQRDATRLQLRPASDGAPTAGASRGSQAARVHASKGPRAAPMYTPQASFDECTWRVTPQSALREGSPTSVGPRAAWQCGSSLSLPRSQHGGVSSPPPSPPTAQVAPYDGDVSSPPPSPAPPKVAPHKPTSVTRVDEGAEGTLDARGADAPSSVVRALCRRLLQQVDPTVLSKVLRALRPTGAFFGLCILLGELENAQIDGCQGFGAGWTCGFTVGCEAWRTSRADGYCWTWIDEIYYGVITYTTIGFGDVSAHTKVGKVIGSLVVILGVLCFTTLLAELNDIKQAKRLGAEKTLRQRLGELEEVIAQDNDGKVTPEEYILFNLKKMGKIDDETLLLLRDQFKALDADGSGELDADDIAMLAQACEQIDD